MSEQPADQPLSTTAMAVDFERHLWDISPGQLTSPKVNLLIRPADLSTGLKPVNLPFEPEHIQRFAKMIPSAHGSFGAGLAGMAWLLGHLDNPIMESAIGLIGEPGDQLILATVIAEVVVATADNIPTTARTLEQDVPVENRIDLRTFLAADGLGSAWTISRDPASEHVWSEIEQSCYPVLDQIGAFGPAPDGDDRPEANGFVAWALASMCVSLRARFAAMSR